MEEGESSQAQEPLMLPGAPRFSKKALCPPGHHSRVRACPLFVLFQWFQSAVSKEDAMPEALKSLIFSNFEPLHKFHTSFLKETEQRLALW